jgi:signal transduction histidine kinase
MSAYLQQLQIALSATAARWAAAFRREGDAWRAGPHAGVGDPAALQTILADPASLRWMSDGLAAGRVRSRAARGLPASLTGGRWFLFPNAEAGETLLVGADDLDKVGREFFRAVSLAGFSGGAPPLGALVPAGGALDETGDFNFVANRKTLLQESFRIAEQIGGADIAELDVDTLLARALKRARDLVDAPAAELALVDAAAGGIRILASDYPPRAQAVIPAGSDLAGQVVGRGKSILVDDFAAWKYRTSAPLFRAAAGVPLRYRSEVIGALAVMDDDPARTFLPEDLQLLELLAPQISIAIRNARLFQELSERIREQKLAEVKLVENARLTALGEMAASVAHELNNPLTTITGFAELIVDDLPPDFPQRADLLLVLQEARRAREVVRGLLDFSRRGDNLIRAVDVNEAVSDVLALIHNIGQAQGVDVQFEAWDDLPAARGDPHQIKQVLLNLIYNAIQSMPQGGTVIIQTASDGRDSPGWIIVRVRDQGIGIPEKYLDQIFEPFFTTKPIGEGTGLGLSISRKIIAEHGGEITVESAENRGSTFTIRLPVKDN